MKSFDHCFLKHEPGALFRPVQGGVCVYGGTDWLMIICQSKGGAGLVSADCFSSTKIRSV